MNEERIGAGEELNLERPRQEGDGGARGVGGGGLEERLPAEHRRLDRRGERERGDIDVVGH